MAIRVWQAEASLAQRLKREEDVGRQLAEQRVITSQARAEADRARAELRNVKHALIDGRKETKQELEALRAERDALETGLEEVTAHPPPCPHAVPTCTCTCPHLPTLAHTCPHLPLHLLTAAPVPACTRPHLPACMPLPSPPARQPTCPPSDPSASARRPGAALDGDVCTD